MNGALSRASQQPCWCARECCGVVSWVTDSACGTQELPVIDLGLWLGGTDPTDPAVVSLCRDVAACLHDTGVLVVRDPRVSYGDNAAFLDMMELYFSQELESKLRDVRAALHYQVGATPENVVSSPRLHCTPRVH